MAKYIGLHLKNNESEAKETLEKLKVNGYVWQDNPYATNILSTNSVTVDA